MPKNVPTAIALPALGEMYPDRPVLKSTWQTLIEAQHYAWGRQGNFVLNLAFDPYWDSLAYASGGDVYHSVGAQSAPGTLQLNQCTGFFQFQRLRYNSSNAAQGYMLDLYAYAKNLDIRVTCQRLDTEDGNTGSSTNVYTLTTSHDATNSEWQLDTQEFTKAEASRGGTYSDVTSLAWFLVYVEAKVPASGTGYLHHLAVREAPITAGTNLPRGA